MVKEILSRSNPLIKEIAKLKQKKYRDNTNQILVEGERLVAELVSRGAEFDYLFFIKDMAVNIKGEMIKTTPEVLAYLSQTVSPPDVIGVIRWKKQSFTSPKTNFLILDNISDPGNLGTLIRAALAFDFRYIYLLNCVDYTNDKVIRSTMGTILGVKLIECDKSDVENLVKNYPCLLADMDGKELNSLPKPKNNIGIVLGNEANGVSKEISDIVKERVAISMKNGVESLNVAVAGSIIMNYFKGE